MNILNIEPLRLYRGGDFKLANGITVSQPTIGKIEEFGEQRYWNAINTLCAAPADMKWQLWDYYQTDYTKIDDYELFVRLIVPALSSKKRLFEEIQKEPAKYAQELAQMSEEEIHQMQENPLKLILGELDFADFSPYYVEEKNQVILYNEATGQTIDRLSYQQLVQAVRKMHFLQRNNEKPGNERTKMDLIEDARDEARAQKNKEFQSCLLPMVSVIGILAHTNVWDMSIYALLYNIRRIGRMKEADALMNGAYCGFADLKKVDKDRFNWLGNIE